MPLYALGFIVGALALQQQATLPNVNWFLAGLITAFFAYFFTQKAKIGISKLLSFETQIAKLLSFETQIAKPLSQFVIALIFGFCWAAGFAHWRLSDELPPEWQQKSITLVGVIASLPENTERATRFTFNVEKILTPKAQVPRHIALTFYHENAHSNDNKNNTLAESTQQFHTGQRWQFSVKLKRPHGTYNPHGFDFEAWALAENIRATGSIKAKSGYKKLSNLVWQPHYLVQRAREAIANRIAIALQNKHDAGIIRALVVGDDSQISRAQWDILLRTGTNHLMSISGLHITMLAGLAFALVNMVWRRAPKLVERIPAKKAATVAGLLAALCYASLAGWSVPTQRTVLMLAVFGLSLMFGRNIGILKALSIAILVVVLVDPWAVIAPGFWLSFGAVAVISYAFTSRLKPAHWFAAAIKTQWAVTLGLLPALLLMFGQTSILSPLANALAIPLISLLVVPLAILGSLLNIDFVLQAAHWILQWCMQGLAMVSAPSFAVWQQAAPSVWAILLAIFGVLWLLLPRGLPMRWLGFLCFLPLFSPQITTPNKGEMQVAVLDVGQGLAVVVQTQAHTLLYDTGPSYAVDNDAASRIVLPFLRGIGAKKLDGLIVSHDDIDHSGGLKSVLNQLPINWFASTLPINAPILNGFEMPKTTKHMRCHAGQNWVWDGVIFEVLHPMLESIDDPNIKDNNKSCVLRISSQHGSVLLTGDIELPAEREILARNTDGLKSDVLIVPHHGSKTSSTSVFVQAVGAKQAIFTVGYLNRFKHPKPLIEKRFDESGAQLLRSDYQGALLLNFSKNQAIKTIAWRQAQPKYWHDRY